MTSHLIARTVYYILLTMNDTPYAIYGTLFIIRVEARVALGKKEEERGSSGSDGDSMSALTDDDDRMEEEDDDA